MERARSMLPRAACRLGLTLLLSLADSGVAHAQAYPVKPIRVVVPFAPGGPNDILARLIAPKLTEAWGQQVIVDNRPGGGTVIGTEVVARAAPDGYTLLVVSTTTSTNPSLLRKLPYDTVRDLAPVILFGSSPNVLMVHPSVPARSVRELIAVAKARPGEVAFASGGNGTSTHLSGEILRLRAAVNMLHVPYKGAAPATVALMSGEVSWMFASILPMLAHVQSGRLRAIAVSSAQRVAALPDTPPVADTLPGFEASPWHGLSAPAGTPKEVIAKLNQEIAKVLKAPEVRERLARDGIETAAGTPEQFDAFLRSEIEKWARVIKEAGIQVQ